jgi:hypothetical protein
MRNSQSLAPRTRELCLLSHEGGLEVLTQNTLYESGRVDLMTPLDRQGASREDFALFREAQSIGQGISTGQISSIDELYRLLWSLGS